jgi:hypothetical protein
MELLLTNTTPIKKINRDFQKAFPYLKLEFYRHKHKPEETSEWEQNYPAHAILEEVAGHIRNGAIKIVATDTVADLEQRFQDEFGLPAQVFRKTGDLWVETTDTDHLTLEKQNKIGETACRPRYNIHTLFL